MLVQVHSPGQVYTYMCYKSKQTSNYVHLPKYKYCIVLLHYI